MTYPCARACEGDDDQDVAGDETEIYTPDALLSNPKSVKQKMSDRSLSLYVCECVRARACVRMRKFVLMCAGRCVCVNVTQSVCVCSRSSTSLRHTCVYA